MSVDWTGVPKRVEAGEQVTNRVQPFFEAELLDFPVGLCGQSSLVCRLRVTLDHRRGRSSGRDSGAGICRKLGSQLLFDIGASVRLLRIASVSVSLKCATFGNSSFLRRPFLINS